MQRGAVELCQHIDAANAGVQAITDGNIDESVLAADRNSRFGAILGQWKEPGSCSSSHDDGECAGSRGDDLFIGHNSKQMLLVSCEES